jgi:uncharacterized protein
MRSPCSRPRSASPETLPFRERLPVATFPADILAHVPFPLIRGYIVEGKPRTTLVAQHRAELEALCRRFRVRRLELFGSSAATGQDRPGESDLDFLVEFESLPDGGYADTYFGLLEALQSLFGRAVDLVIPSTIKNPYFPQSVERTKTLLYAA